MSTTGISERIEAYAGRPDELIQALQLVQEALGYVSEEMEERIAATLGLSIGQVHGVVTFYHLFRTRPAGRHTIRLCLGTACHVLGADKILTALEEQLGVSVGGTTEDGLFTLDVVRCLGTCSLAPVLMIDDDVHGRLTPEGVFKILETYAEREEAVG
ncbi:MAG: NADH-quinone oxidoreductase subunit NuoE [Candidatus Bipolaricaulia bacterium]